MSAPRASQGRTDAGGGEQLLEVAAEHATNRVPTAKPGQTAGEVRDATIGSHFESAVNVAALEGEEVVGILSIEALLAADPATRIDAVMDADPPVVEPGVDQEHAAWAMCRRAEASLAVVDSDGRFVGLIPPDRMLAVLLAEHDEDLARIGGYLAGSRRLAARPRSR
jgi:magnesium transporter